MEFIFLIDDGGVVVKMVLVFFLKIEDSLESEKLFFFVCLKKIFFLLVIELGCEELE